MRTACLAGGRSDAKQPLGKIDSRANGLCATALRLPGRRGAALGGRGVNEEPPRSLSIYLQGGAAFCWCVGLYDRTCEAFVYETAARGVLRTSRRGKFLVKSVSVGYVPAGRSALADTIEIA